MATIEETNAGALVLGAPPNDPLNAIGPTTFPPDQAKKSCTAAGGTWNAATNSCDLPQPKEQTETFRSGTNERTSGLTIPGQAGGFFTPNGEVTQEEFLKFKAEQGFTPGGEGQTFLGLSSEEAANVSAQQAGREATPPGAFEGTEALEFRRQESLKLEVASSLGITRPLTPNELTLDWVQALKTGVAIAAPTALAAGIAAGTAGFVAGAISGGGATPVSGLSATAGAVQAGTAAASLAFGASYVTAIRSNLKTQTADIKAVGRVSVTQTLTALNSIVSDTNTNPGNAAQNAQDFNEILSKFEADFKDLRTLNEKDLNNYLGEDGTKVLGRFKIFDETVKPAIILRMQSAVLNPDPNKAQINEQAFNDALDE